MEKKVDHFLNDLWMEMQDNYKDNILKFEGAINMALELGLITKDKYELWLFRVKNCPDKTHIGGRLWCAYCGEIEPKTEEDCDM